MIGEYLRGVDWSRTKGYQLGLSGIYINKRGREAQGIVKSDEYKALKFPDFEIYMALIFQASERLWLKHLRELLDSLFLKNQRDGLMHQPLRGKRRFALTPGMLETLALIAVMQETEEGLETRPLRLDRLIDRLDRRYGILVARPPTGREADPVAVSAMLQNQRTLRRRLRESGLFVDDPGRINL